MMCPLGLVQELVEALGVRLERAGLASAPA